MADRIIHVGETSRTVTLKKGALAAVHLGGNTNVVVVGSEAHTLTKPAKPKLSVTIQDIQKQITVQSKVRTVLLRQRGPAGPAGPAGQGGSGQGVGSNFERALLSVSDELYLYFGFGKSLADTAWRIRRVLRTTGAVTTALPVNNSGVENLGDAWNNSDPRALNFS